MQNCQEPTVERLAEFQIKRKFWYDWNAVKRKIWVGDQVLLLNSPKPNTLAVKWTGPGKVEKQLSKTNYLVRLIDKGEKMQLYHINMLKSYHSRPERINFLLEEKSKFLGTEPDLEINYPLANPNM